MALALIKDSLPSNNNKTSTIDPLMIKIMARGMLKMGALALAHKLLFKAIKYLACQRSYDKASL